MTNENKKSNKRAFIFGTLAVLLIVIAVAVTYKLVNVKPEGETPGTVYADNRNDVKPIEVVTPAPSEDKQIFVMDVEEVLDAQPIVTDVTPVPDEVVEVLEPVEEKDIVDNQETEEVKDDEPKKTESKKEKKVVIDESPKTIKEKNVNEYKGGEKTGTGNSFMDQMPDNPPSGKEEVDSSIEPSGVAVGTWN